MSDVAVGMLWALYVRAMERCEDALKRGDYQAWLLANDRALIYRSALRNLGEAGLASRVSA